MRKREVTKRFKIGLRWKVLTMKGVDLTRIKVISLPSLTFTADASGEGDVLGHESDTVGVNRAQVGILEQVGHEGFGCLLDRQD